MLKSIQSASIYTHGLPRWITIGLDGLTGHGECHKHVPCCSCLCFLRIRYPSVFPRQWPLHRCCIPFRRPLFRVCLHIVFYSSCFYQLAILIDRYLLRINAGLFFSPPPTVSFSSLHSPRPHIVESPRQNQRGLKQPAFIVPRSLRVDEDPSATADRSWLFRRKQYW